MKIFDPEGIIMEVLGKLADIVFINFTFVILSLPVLTMGAAITAMYDCCFSLINDTEDSFLPRQFVRSFAKNMKRGTASWGIALVPIIFLAAYSWITGFFDGILGRMYRITFWVLLFVFIFGFQYIFPLVAKTEKKVIDVWKLAWKLAITALPWSFLNMLVLVGFSVLVTLVLPANTAVYLWGFLLFGLITFLSSFVIQKVFQKYGGRL